MTFFGYPLQRAGPHAYGGPRLRNDRRAPATMSSSRLLPMVLAALLLRAAPLVAQEPITFLNQKEWSASGVCVGLYQCAFCSARDGTQAGVSLEVAPPDDVSVTIDGATAATTVAIEIGSARFDLIAGARRFTASRTNGRRIIEAMRRAPSLVLRRDGDPAATSYSYDLAEFPAAYAAIVKACPSATPK
jgi:hypothetical protein